MRRGRATLLAGLVLLLVVAMAAPASADFSNGPSAPGVVVRYDSLVGAWLEDAEAELVALLGPPAEEFCLFEGFDEGVIQNVETPAGPIIHHFDVVLDTWIYEASNLWELCDELSASGAVEPLAIGEARMVVTQNYWNYEPGSRSGASTISANGVVYDADGDTWNFHGHESSQVDRDGNFRLLKSTVKLNKRGK